MRWDLLKFNIQTESIRFSKLKAKERREKEAKTLEEINKLDRLIINGEADKNDLHKYERAKETIEEIKTYRARGEYIRSRIEFTAFFYSQAKHHYEKKTISSLISNFLTA